MSEVYRLGTTQAASPNSDPGLSNVRLDSAVIAPRLPGLEDSEWGHHKSSSRWARWAAPPRSFARSEGPTQMGASVIRRGLQRLLHPSRPRIPATTLTLHPVSGHRP